MCSIAYIYPVPSTCSVTGIAGAYSESKLTGNLRDQKPNTVPHNPQSNHVKIEKTTGNWYKTVPSPHLPAKIPSCKHNYCLPCDRLININSGIKQRLQSALHSQPVQNVTATSLAS